MPTLVLWGSQDPLFPDPDQNRLRDALDAAARSHDTTSYWKQYGVRPLPKPNEPQTDIGHNVRWDAPDMVASDIDSFIRHGAPSIWATAMPPDTPKMVVESGKATVIRLGERPDGRPHRADSRYGASARSSARPPGAHTVGSNSRGN